jgi:hypothetical protein
VQWWQKDASSGTGGARGDISALDLDALIIAAYLHNISTAGSFQTII